MEYISFIKRPRTLSWYFFVKVRCFGTIGLEGSVSLNSGEGTTEMGFRGEENELINIWPLVEIIYHVLPCGWAE